MAAVKLTSVGLFVRVACPASSSLFVVRSARPQLVAVFAGKFKVRSGTSSPRTPTRVRTPPSFLLLLLLIVIVATILMVVVVVIVAFVMIMGL